MKLYVEAISARLSGINYTRASVKFNEALNLPLQSDYAFMHFMCVINNYNNRQLTIQSKRNLHFDCIKIKSLII